MRTLTPSDVSAGLPASAAAAALLGKAGATILLILLFLAVTSASSAELIAVSSILTYDVYKVAFFNIGVLDNSLFMRFCRNTSTRMQLKRRCSKSRTRWKVILSYGMHYGLNVVYRLSSSQSAWASPGSSSIILVSRWVGFTYVNLGPLRKKIYC
jgi:hypothetical protein